MKNLLQAFAFFASCAAFAVPTSATIITFAGVSQNVENPDTGEVENYTITFNFDSDVAPIVFNETTFAPPFVNYQRAYYTNLLSATIDGPRYSFTLQNGFSSVSTLSSDRFRDGNAGFIANVGSDGGEVGYAMQMLYFPHGAFATTAFPTSLNIATAFENGFNLTEFFLNEDDPESPFIDQRTVLNFRFASGGILPAAAAVPEPGSWAMMIAGFALVGGAMRRRSKVSTRVSYSA